MMNAKLVILITLKNILSIYCLQDSIEDSSCTRDYTCIPINDCHQNNSIVYPCDSHLDHVCCPRYVDTRQTAPSKEVFPENCGPSAIIDRITNGNVATLGQFPWMALLGYTQQGLDLMQFSCGGSLITNQYVLTAAHCIETNSNLKLSVVRLGEFNLTSPIDCTGKEVSSICALPHVDVGVDKTICHQKYNNATYENDIALVKLKNQVNFTSYVVPVCLPFPKFNIKTPLPSGNNKVLISGWGKTKSDNVGTSVVLMFAPVNLWDSIRCNNSLPETVKPIKDSQICASGDNNEDSCKGDSGGPMTQAIVVDSDERSFQIGIVSFGSSDCGDKNSPTVYTKVEHYLDWIRNNVN